MTNNEISYGISPVRVTVTKGDEVLEEYVVDSNEAFTQFINKEAVLFEAGQYLTFIEWIRKAVVSVSSGELATNAIAVLRNPEDDWAIRYTVELV